MNRLILVAVGFLVSLAVMDLQANENQSRINRIPVPSYEKNLTSNSQAEQMLKTVNRKPAFAASEQKSKIYSYGACRTGYGAYRYSNQDMKGYTDCLEQNSSEVYNNHAGAMGFVLPIQYK